MDKERLWRVESYLQGIEMSWNSHSPRIFCLHPNTSNSQFHSSFWVLEVGGLLQRTGYENDLLVPDWAGFSSSHGTRGNTHYSVAACRWNLRTYNVFLSALFHSIPSITVGAESWLWGRMKLETGLSILLCWLVVWNMFIFPYFSIWKCHHPNWQSHIF